MNGSKGMEKRYTKRERVTTETATAASTSNVIETPSIYPGVQQVLEQVLQQHSGDVERKLEYREQLLSSLCNAVAYLYSEKEALDSDTFENKVRQCVQDAAGRQFGEAQLLTISEALVSRLAEVVSKFPVLPELRQLPQEEEEEEGGGEKEVQNDSNLLSAKRHRGEAERGPVLESYEPFNTVVSSLTAFSPAGHSGDSILPTPPLLPSVFSESALCPVHCVTFESLPGKYCTHEAMKRQLEEICFRIPNAFFINIHCIPAEHCAIVSFNSNETAAAVMFSVNSVSASSGTGSKVDSATPTVRVVAASEEHQKMLWEPLVERARVLEEQWRSWHAKYSARPSHEIRREWSNAKMKEIQLEKELAQQPSSNTERMKETEADAGATPTAAEDSDEQMKKKLTILQTRLECKRVAELAEKQMKDLYGDAYMQHLKSGPMETTYSSSSANFSNFRKLLFIRELPFRMNDEELLQFLYVLGVHPVHIWRDPASETTICVEVPTVGHVFGVLQQLDGTGMRFNGAVFSCGLYKRCAGS